MSKEILRSFLPWAVNFLESHEQTKKALQYVFPDYIEQLCPAPSWTIPLLSDNYFINVKWPSVGMLCVIGMSSGLSMGARVLLMHARRKRQTSGFFHWGFAFLWYGFMCLGGLFYHSLTPGKEVFYVIDVISTGCSGLSVIAGFANICKLIDDRRLFWQILSLAAYASVTIAGVVGNSFVREQIYILSAVGMLIPTLLYLIKSYISLKKVEQTTFPRSLQWLTLGAVGYGLAAVSIPANTWCCMTFGANGTFMFGIFLGCDIALLCAYNFFIALSSEQKKKLE